MASTKEYLEYCIDNLDNISYKPMMGEYLLYYNGLLFGGIYDDRLLIKKTNSNSKYHMDEEIPYPNAKAMYLVDDIDDKDKLQEIIIKTCNELNKIKK